MTAIKKQLTGILRDYYIVLHKFGTVDIYNDSEPNKWALPDSFSKEKVFGVGVSDKEKEAISTIHSLISAHGLEHRCNNDEWLPPLWWPHWAQKENEEPRITFINNTEFINDSVEPINVTHEVAREWALTQVIKQYEAWESIHGTMRDKEYKLKPEFKYSKGTLSLALYVSDYAIDRGLRIHYTYELYKISQLIIERTQNNIDKLDVIFSWYTFGTINATFSASEQNKESIIKSITTALNEYEEELNATEKSQEIKIPKKECKPKDIETTEPTQIVDALNHISFSIESLTELIRNRT